VSNAAPFEPRPDRSAPIARLFPRRMADTASGLRLFVRVPDFEEWRVVLFGRSVGPSGW
jgi:hypothetical protein